LLQRPRIAADRQALAWPPIVRQLNWNLRPTGNGCRRFVPEPAAPAMAILRFRQICVGVKSDEKSIEDCVRYFVRVYPAVFTEADKPTQPIFHSIGRQRFAELRPFGVVLPLSPRQGIYDCAPEVRAEVAPSLRAEAVPGRAHRVDHESHEP